MKQGYSEASPSSASVAEQSQQVIAMPSSSTSFSVPAIEDPTHVSREAGGQESIAVERRGSFSAVCKWTVSNFPKVKARALWSKYFEVGGYDCRLLVYPKGDSQALPGYISFYLQIMDPRGTSSSKWDCFASYRLALVNHADESKTVHRDSWHRFSTKKKSHGWCDFTPSSSIFDSKAGYLYSGDCILVIADIHILNESVIFTRDNSEAQSISSLAAGPVSDVLNGKFTWKVHNFSLFKEMIKTQKIMSPVFSAGECNLRISVYQSSVNGSDHLSMCLESKESDKALTSDRSCWCLFRMSVLNMKLGLNHMHRDSYGRFAADNNGGDNTSLGWNDYMKMSDFVGPDSGFLVDDTALFCASFNVIKEVSGFSKNGGSSGGRGNGNGARKADGHSGKFTWRIENFTKLKDLLKKRKITGLCIKSRRFQIGNRDCRLIVYPRGQSQPPCHLSVFLEVTDSRNTSTDWSCFVSHRLSVVNQKAEDKSVMKESQNRYSKVAKDWGWREFVTLTSLFDQDSGFLVQDIVIFSAEVLILKETSTVQDVSPRESVTASSGGCCSEDLARRRSFTWRVENFLSFKEIMETRKIFSKYFQAGGCELRVGVYESFDTICIYLESDGSDPDKNFWVRYRMAMVNQKNCVKTVWKESSICTKTWNNSVLQFMKVSDMMDVDAGFLARDTVVFVCEILDCCPWFEFSDLEVWPCEDDQEDPLTTDPDEPAESEESEGMSGDEEDMFRNLLSRAGFHFTYGDGDNPSQPQVTLREKLLMDAGAMAGFLTGLRVYLDDPAKVKRLLLPTDLSQTNDGRKIHKTNGSSPSLMNLLMGVKVLQQAIVDLLLDIMVECCQPSQRALKEEESLRRTAATAAVALSDTGRRETEAPQSSEIPIHDRLESGTELTSNASAVQSSDPCKASAASLRHKTKWPEQSEELLGLIVNSLRALDGAAPQGCPEPRRRPQSAQKIALVLDKAPEHLRPDLVSLVPRLVEHSEHPLAARALLDRLRSPDPEPSLRLPVFGALNEMECGSDTWESLLLQSLELLNDSVDEPLAATVDFTFKAAARCQHLPEAVRSVRARLKCLGSQVPLSVLELLNRTVNSWGDVAEIIMKDIDADEDFCEHCSTLPCSLFPFGDALPSSSDDRCHRNFSDVYILIEMLSIPCLAAGACQTIGRAAARGAITAQSVSAVLERRASSCAEQVVVGGDGGAEPDFSSVLGLVESLALSLDLRVRSFSKTLYRVLFRLCAGEPYRRRLLKRMVDRAADNGRDAELDLDALVLLVSQEPESVRPALRMMREAVELANTDRAALWHQLCAAEDEIVRVRDEKKSELSAASRDKALLTRKLGDSDASAARLKLEMRAESDRFVREKKEMSARVQEMEGQLEWLRSERDDEIAKLRSEKKAIQDRLRDAESQLAQLKSQKRDELKRAAKEKNVLAERLKGAEMARKRFDEELKRHATENLTREEARMSLEDEVRRLTHTVGQTEGEKREREQQVARCEAYIDGMASKLQTCEQYIRSLELSLQEEMSRHAPLYGAGLDALTMKELDTLSCIHEEGLNQIHAMRKRKVGGAASAASALMMRPPPPKPGSAVGMVGTHPLVPDSVRAGNGHLNASLRPWFCDS